MRQCRPCKVHAFFSLSFSVPLLAESERSTDKVFIVPPPPDLRLFQLSPQRAAGARFVEGYRRGRHRGRGSPRHRPCQVLRRGVRGDYSRLKFLLGFVFLLSLSLSLLVVTTLGTETILPGFWCFFPASTRVRARVVLLCNRSCAIVVLRRVEQQ